jgi:hypothetical protein
MFAATLLPIPLPCHKRITILAWTGSLHRPSDMKIRSVSAYAYWRRWPMERQHFHLRRIKTAHTLFSGPRRLQISRSANDDGHDCSNGRALIIPSTNDRPRHAKRRSKRCPARDTPLSIILTDFTPMPACSFASI